jgi:YggT family protein
MPVVGKIINFLFVFYYLLLALRAVLPWFGLRWKSRGFDFLYSLTEPLLRPIRMGLPPRRIGMDVSPYVGIILLWILQRFLHYWWRI